MKYRRSSFFNLTLSSLLLKMSKKGEKWFQNCVSWKIFTKSLPTVYKGLKFACNFRSIVVHGQRHISVGYLPAVCAVYGWTNKKIYINKITRPAMACDCHRNSVFFLHSINILYEFNCDKSVRARCEYFIKIHAYICIKNCF